MLTGKERFRNVNKLFAIVSFNSIKKLLLITSVWLLLLVLLQLKSLLKWSKMSIFQSFVCKSTIGLVLIAIILGLPSIRSAPLEEAKFLRQIANQYSAPLVVSFLHSRIQKNEEMISKIKSSLKNLDKSKVEVFGLAEKTLELLDEQLTALEKADYFDFNGTEKVKYFIEQFIMQNEMYPVEFGSYGVVKVAVTSDVLLEDLAKKRSHDLINETNSMIQTYLTDIDVKERSLDSSRMQKLASFLAKQELQLLANYSYPPDHNNYHYYDLNNPTKVALGKVLRKVKTIVDFFYSQFNRLTDPKSSIKTSEVSASQKPEIAVVTVKPQETSTLTYAPKIIRPWVTF